MTKHPLTGPSGHLSPGPGERKRCSGAGVYPAGFPLPRAGGEVVCEANR
jgi:hypothetical protein